MEASAKDISPATGSVGVGARARGGRLRLDNHQIDIIASRLGITVIPRNNTFKLDFVLRLDEKIETQEAASFVVLQLLSSVGSIRETH